MNLKLIRPALLALSLLLSGSGCDRPTENNPGDDGLPPAVPSGVNLYFAADGEILIYWNSNIEADLEGYKIYRSTGGPAFENIAFTANNYFLDDSLEYDSVYSYRISAVDTWKRESSPSIVINARPENKYPPEAPEYVNINARNWSGKKSVYLYWQRNSETDIAGYYIYRNTAGNFTADSSGFIGYSDKESWIDTLNLLLLTRYYYKIRSVDKGGLLSGVSGEVQDEILRVPEIVYPANDGLMVYHGNFKFTSSGAPAVYKIAVQSNPIFGTLWEKEIGSNIIEDTMAVQFDYPYVEANKEYYWRVASYSVSNDPNSITELYKFKIKP